MLGLHNMQNKKRALISYDKMYVWFTTTYVIYYWNTRGGRGHDHMVVWFTTKYVMYYWNTRGRRGRDHNVIRFTTTYVMYYWNTSGLRGRDHMVVWFTTTYVIYYWNTRGRRGCVYRSHVSCSVAFSVSYMQYCQVIHILSNRIDAGSKHYN